MKHMLWALKRLLFGIVLVLIGIVFAVLTVVCNGSVFFFPALILALVFSMFGLAVAIFGLISNKSELDLAEEMFEDAKKSAKDREYREKMGLKAEAAETEKP